MRKTLLTAAIFGTAMLLGPAAQAAVFADFEAADGYTAGSDINGVDGWTSIGASGVVTPDGGGSGYVTVLAGSQSFVNYGGGFYGKNFDGGTTLADIQTIQWLLNGVDSVGTSTALYLSANGTSSTNAGIQANFAGGQFELNGAVSTSTAVVVPVIGDTYLLEMEFDFNGGTFEGFATDITNAGSRTSLGSIAYVAPGGGASEFATSGGIILFRNQVNTAIDQIQLIPEPASMALLGLGGLMMLSRRKR